MQRTTPLKYTYVWIFYKIKMLKYWTFYTPHKLSVTWPDQSMYKVNHWRFLTLILITCEENMDILTAQY